MKMRKLLASTLALGILLNAGTGAARAQTGVSLFDPPTGFYLQPSAKEHRGKLYGPTASAANWNFSQWEIPQDLPAFDATGVSKNQWATVTFQNGLLTVTENAQNYPCSKQYATGALPQEWGMFAAPNSAQDPGFPLAVKDNHETVADLSGIEMTATVNLKTLKIIDNTCPITKAFLTGYIVLANKVSHQMLFYGVGFANFLTKGGMTFPRAATMQSQTQGTMYFNGQNRESGAHNFFAYGVPVNVISSQPKIMPGQTIHYQLALLPGLLNAVHAGQASGMSQDLTNWVVGGFYAGQSLTGHVVLETNWSDFSVTLTKN